MQLISFGITDPGKKREINEDYFGLYDNLGLYLVADGMGGHQAGEIASHFIVNSVAKFFQAALEENEDFTWPIDLDPKLSYEEKLIHSAVRLANKQLHRVARESTEYRGMGTTLVGLYIPVLQKSSAAAKGDRFAYIFNVGDSRAYIIRGKRMRQLSRDHTWVEEQLRQRVISYKEAQVHQWRNIITRALGSNPEVELEVKKEKIRPGDYFLLCSDGLTNMVRDVKIRQIVGQTGTDLETACHDLVTEANDSGGLDNITAILLYIQ